MLVDLAISLSPCLFEIPKCPATACRTALPAKRIDLNQGGQSNQSQALAFGSVIQDFFRILNFSFLIQNNPDIRTGSEMSDNDDDRLAQSPLVGSLAGSNYGSNYGSNTGSPAPFVRPHDPLFFAASFGRLPTSHPIW